MQLNHLIQLMSLSDDNKLPTEHSLKRVLAIYVGRLGVFIAGSLLAALLLVSVSFLIRTPYHLIIALAASVLAGVSLLSNMHMHRSTMAFPRIKVPVLERYKFVTEETETARGSILNAEATLLSELEAVENHLELLTEKENSINRLFEHNLHSWHYDFPPAAFPFAIREETKLAKVFFLGSFATVVLGATIATLILVRAFGTGRTVVFLLAPLVEILLTFLAQGLISVIFAGVGSPRQLLERIRRFLLLPSFMLALSLVVLVTTRFAPTDQFNASWLFSLSVVSVTLLCPIIAGGFLVVGNEMSWSRATQTEFSAVEQQKAKISETLFALRGKLRVLRMMQDQPHATVSETLFAKSQG